MFEHWLDFHLETIVLLGGFVGVVGLFTRWVKHTWIKFNDKLDKFTERWNAAAQLIEDQLQHDSGSSMRDQVAKISDVTETVADIQSDVKQMREDAAQRDAVADKQWKEIHKEAAANSDAVKAAMKSNEARIESLEDVRAQLSVQLPKSLSVLNGLVRRVSRIEKKLDLIHDEASADAPSPLSD